MPLFTRPQTEKSITHLADPINVPEPISRRVLDASLAAYYGPDLSILIEGVAIDDVSACNLSDADPRDDLGAHAAERARSRSIPCSAGFRFAMHRPSRRACSFIMDSAPRWAEANTSARRLSMPRSGRSKRLLRRARSSRRSMRAPAAAWSN